MHLRYLKNIKPLAQKPNAAFILMGMSSAILWSDSPIDIIVPVAQAQSFVQTVAQKPEPPSVLVTDKNKDRLHKIGNFKLPDNIKPNNVSKHVAGVQLEKKEYFLALASQAEGFRSNIYKDNQGWAVGNGWNLTKQSPEYNRVLAQAVFKDKKTVNTLTHMSGKSDVPISASQMRSVEIAPQQALQVTYLIGEKIKKEYVIPGISQVIQNNEKLDPEKADKMAARVF